MDARQADAQAEEAMRELDRAITALLLREPFYAHILAVATRVADERVATAAVALAPTGVQLLVNPRFFLEELDDGERVGVAKHEALHLAFGHLAEPRAEGADPELLNIAADLVVNQFVDPWPLPDGAILLSSFPELGLQPNRSMKWYLERLERARSTADESVRAALERLTARWREGRLGRHSHWAASGGRGFEDAGLDLTEAIREMVETAVERAVSTSRSRLSEREWGMLPSRLRSSIEQAAERSKPRVDWRRALRIFASSGYRTRIVPTTRRMSKRFGEFPGIRIKRERRIAVVVDTSGSVDDVLLGEFFREIDAIWRTGATLVVIECDADVQNVSEYRGKPPTEVAGRGGTEFDPAFRWLRERGRGRFDACIYLTDGAGPAPTVRPPCPLLWVVSPGGSVGEHLRYGRSIELSVGR